MSFVCGGGARMEIWRLRRRPLIMGLRPPALWAGSQRRLAGLLGRHRPALVVQIELQAVLQLFDEGILGSHLLKELFGIQGTFDRCFRCLCFLHKDLVG